MRLLPNSAKDRVRAYFVALEVFALGAFFCTREISGYRPSGSTALAFAWLFLTAAVLLWGSSLVFCFRRNYRAIAISGFVVGILIIWLSTVIRTGLAR
jgi:hypothetical protein